MHEAKIFGEITDLIEILYQHDGKPATPSSISYTDQIAKRIIYLSKGEINIDMEIKEQNIYFTIKYPNEEVKKFFEG